jgi:NADPH:quinone reductase-like Zn-dependent oxidoreductase
MKYKSVIVTRKGRSAKYYGTGISRFNRRPFLEDWATLFKLLEEGRIKPVIMKKFPILEAAQANELLESGEVIGNIVLVAPELL